MIVRSATENGTGVRDVEKSRERFVSTSGRVPNTARYSGGMGAPTAQSLRTPGCSFQRRQVPLCGVKAPSKVSGRGHRRRGFQWPPQTDVTESVAALASTDFSVEKATEPSGRFAVSFRKNLRAGAMIEFIDEKDIYESCSPRATIT